MRPAEGSRVQAGNLFADRNAPNQFMEEIKRKRASLRKTPEKSHNTTAFMTPELITAEEASANLEKELKKA